MKGLFPREPFDGFGPSAHDVPGQVRPLFGVRGKRTRTLRIGVQRDVPHLPGVYGMIDPEGELIYVGKAKSLRRRLLGYFCPDSRDKKAGNILRDSYRLVWEIAPSEFAALLRELELIRRFQPRYNVQGQPRRHRRCYICVGRPPATHAFVVTRLPRRARACFGPFAGLGRTREAVRCLNDWYRLRDCPQKQTMIFADQSELFPVQHGFGCIRHEIGNCLGPCGAACTREEYAFHVEAMLDFLHGKDTTPLEMLDREMMAASESLAFERAAVLRDRLGKLQWLHEHLARLRHAITYSFLYPVDSHDGGQMWYLIRQGYVHAALPAVGKEEIDRVGERLDTIYRGKPPGPPGLEEIDGVLLVAGWFRRHRAERKRVIPVEKVRQWILTRGGEESVTSYSSSSPSISASP